MTTGKLLRVSELDFNTIKGNLKAYLENQSVLNDYNFEGSAIDAMLDVFAYVTHYNSFNANLALNETFIDSAQLRESVVSHAKLLGYTPRSAFAPKAVINITINNPVDIVNQDGSYKTITMNKGTQFSSLINGTTYTFVTTKTIVTSRDSNGAYIFSGVEILQGKYQTQEYIYDTSTAEKFELTSENAVTSSLTVNVQESETNTATTNYTLASNLVDILSTSTAYFLNEGRSGFYEVSFGDNIVGKRPTNGNIIQLEYLNTNLDAANGANVFTLADTIQGNSDVTITTVTRASGGSDKEDIDSVKFNAPLSFVSQNRAVTPDDYKSIIQQNFANIDAIAVWGGEDNDPPDYGKVYISIAPKDAETLSSTDKEFIKSQYLKPKNVVSITPEIVDPAYTYIDLQIFYKYNPNVSDLSADAISNLIRTTVDTYNNDELKRFDGVFRYSNLSTKIDNTDAAIVSSTTRIKMKKRFNPTLNTETRYQIVFSSPLYSTSSEEQIISSSEFTYLSKQCTLRDKLNTDGTRRIQIVSGTGISQSVLLNDVGTVTESEGKIVLNGFAPTAIIGTYIEITATPNSNDLSPKRNELLSILVSDATITGEVDTMVTGGTSAGIEYTTTSRY